ncbi:MAG TPA: hypothetical protein VIW46_13520 [Acidimicrobiia bacterium]|jgi:hypothetical protein
METTELLMHLAEIAGVFVGFGALISIRSEATRDEEVMMIRMIVLFAILVAWTRRRTRPTPRHATEKPNPSPRTETVEPVTWTINWVVF